MTRVDCVHHIHDTNVKKKYGKKGGTPTINGKTNEVEDP